MKSSIFYAVLLSVAATGFVAWRVYAVKTYHPAQFEILEDISGSHGAVCASLQGLAELVLESPDALAGSTLTVLVTGDQSTTDEPRRIGTYPIPTIRRAAEGHDEIARRWEAILADLQSKCKSLRQTTTSPIFLGVKQAVADLRGHGCGADSRCKLFVDSDLEDNVEPSLRESLKRTNSKIRPLPAAINNAGIQVAFCGLAVTVGRAAGSPRNEVGRSQPHDGRWEDRLHRTWLTLFITPSAVRFEPYCFAA